MSDLTTERRFDAIFNRLGDLSGRIVDLDIKIRALEKIVGTLARRYEHRHD